jgi:hypothetical protein
MEWLRTPAAARYIGHAPRTLEKWRLRGSGPQYSRVPGHRTVVYSRAALDRWLAQGTRSSTSDPGPELEERSHGGS